MPRDKLVQKILSAAGRDKLVQEILSAAGSGDWKRLAKEAAKKWSEKDNSLSECGGGTYFHAVQRGFHGHMGEWMAAVESERHAPAKKPKTRKAASPEPPVPALDEIDKWLKGE